MTDLIDNRPQLTETDHTDADNDNQPPEQDTVSWKGRKIKIPTRYED